MFDYPVTLTPDGDSVLVSSIGMREASTFGADEDQALLQAVDALATALSFYIDARKPLPPASKARHGQRCVRPRLPAGPDRSRCAGAGSAAERARRLKRPSAAVSGLAGSHVDAVGMGGPRGWWCWREQATEPNGAGH